MTAIAHDATPSRPPSFDPPFTVMRLNAIRPGEVVVYYRGSLAQDRARAEREGLAYAGVLRAIVAAAETLVDAGRATLGCRKIDDGAAGLDAAPTFEYFATGRSWDAPIAMQRRAVPAGRAA
jgi:hypothetical protein